MTWHRLDSTEHPAPRDGTRIDLWMTPKGLFTSGEPYFRVPDCWHSMGKWWVYDEHGDDQCRSEVPNVTHWMPRPPPPKDEG